ncbi:MAG: hypothetical protein IT210_10565 [Armatimonadetes bacterium]|nr:hypothetical protein [Armatimonadota bacterium]
MAEKLNPNYYWISESNLMERHFESVEAYQAFYESRPRDPRVIDRIWTGPKGKIPSEYRENGSVDHEV